MSSFIVVEVNDPPIEGEQNHTRFLINLAIYEGIESRAWRIGITADWWFSKGGPMLRGPLLPWTLTDDLADAAPACLHFQSRFSLATLTVRVSSTGYDFPSCHDNLLVKWFYVKSLNAFRDVASKRKWKGESLVSFAYRRRLFQLAENCCLLYAITIKARSELLKRF